MRGPRTELSFESWSDDDEPAFAPRMTDSYRAQAGASTSASPSASAPASSASAPDTDLPAQLRAANAQIARLKQLLEATLAGDGSSSEADSDSDAGSSDAESSVCASESSHSAADSGGERRALARRAGLGAAQGGAGKGKGKAVGPTKGKRAGTGKGKARVEVRDDDTHYFNSYAQNGTSSVTDCTRPSADPHMRFPQKSTRRCSRTRRARSRTRTLSSATRSASGTPSSWTLGVARAYSPVSDDASAPALHLGLLSTLADSR